ncbi:hypothetical protein OKW41_006123 [Paraburkholderia sp. UCT70]|uniref:hypothetical protein n=1 Tax=Paraburkholderia sp. UCT70 TaxID=2991068 RepID=UPI003D217DCB
MIEVEAQYDWKGNLRQFYRAGTWIPVDPGNRHYQEIISSIDAGTCRLSEPQFTDAIEYVSEDGRVTGYACGANFVPIENGNAVYEILNKQITAGTCKVTAPAATVPLSPSSQITVFQVAVIFERCWPHLQQAVRSRISWAFSDNAPTREFEFSLFNLEGGTETVDALISKKLTGVALPHQIGSPPSVAAFVVDIPVGELRRVLKHCLRVGDESVRSLLDDLIAQNLWQTGRKKSDGPSSRWLLHQVNLYVHEFVSDLANRVVEGYWLEYGGLPAGYLAPRTAQNGHRIFAKMAAGNVVIHRLQHAGSFGLQVPGTWGPSVGLAAVSFGTESSMSPLRRALARVSMMAESGFTMEALLLVNSVLEVAVKQVLCAVVQDDNELLHRVESIGHRQRLAILANVAADASLNVGPQLAQKIAAADKLYDHRNDYIHDLALPAKKLVLDGKERSDLSKILDQFVTPHEQQLLFNAMHSIVLGGKPIRHVIAAALPPKKTGIEKVVTTVVNLVKQWQFGRARRK